MINRILKSLSKNYPIETVGFVWESCRAYSLTMEIMEDSLQLMCLNQLTNGFFSAHSDKLDRGALVKFAQSLGLYGIENPEAIPYDMFPNLEDLSNMEILKGIETVLGFPISFPTIFTGGMERSVSDYGIWSIRHLHYLWVMKRILELCPDRNSRIIEIGAGIGILGYYLDELGYKDYTAIDLARVNAVQTYYLSKNLPERNFILSHEREYPFEDTEAIKILHTTDFKNVPKGRYDLMVNIDGLTEFPIEDAREYIHSDCAPLLLSINHEANPFRVIQIAEPAKHLVSRQLFWIRDGYVEELYKT